MDSLDMSGKVVLVTGGARGVGRGITDRFLDFGAQVAICGRHQPDDPRGAVWYETDVRDADQVARLVTSVVERFGRLDVAVSNAGGSPAVPSAEASPRFNTSIVALNLLGAMFVAQQAYLVMREQPEGGCIINITSVSGIRATPFTAAYGAAKAGLINLTETLAMEWAPKVRVNCVLGGVVRTELSHLHYGDEEGVAAVAATVPMGRLAEPSDIGNACVMLASPLAAYISGATLAVHGGGEPPPYLGAARNTERAGRGAS